MKNAVLLAAGRGTRMGALTATTPKPLLTVGGRPIIEHILIGLREGGVDRVVVVSGYLAEQLEQVVGDGSRFSLRIRYVRQERPQGTAKALLVAAPLLLPEPFVLGWGDVLVEPGFHGDLVREFERHPCDVLLAVNEVDDPWRGAAVYVDESWRVTRIVEKPPRGTSSTRWNNAGIFVCSPKVIDHARAVQQSERGEYELPQAFAQMIRDGAELRALPIRGFWSDVGTPEDLAAANAWAGCR